MSARAVNQAAIRRSPAYHGNALVRSVPSTTEAPVTLAPQPQDGIIGPECRYACDDPVCRAVCEPVCEPPRCEMQCTGGVNPNTCGPLICSTRCASDAIATESCPMCETVCRPPMGCPSEHCSPLCEAPQCSWSCAKPSNCPRPRCELQCERPACEHTSSAAPTQGIARVSALVALLL
jgi:hypothetical protein